MLKVNDNLWIISDTHFGHKNIVEYANRNDDHEIEMLYNWTNLVRPGDQILHMGDVMFAQAEKWKVLINNLPGEKYLIKGNHDHQKDSFYQGCGFHVIEPFIANDFAFTHRPASKEHPAPPGFWHTNIHGHIHNNKLNPDVDGEICRYKYYINVSVEVQEYRPVPLKEIWGGTHDAENCCSFEECER